MYNYLHLLELNFLIEWILPLMSASDTEKLTFIVQLKLIYSCAVLCQSKCIVGFQPNNAETGLNQATDVPQQEFQSPIFSWLHHLYHFIFMDKNSI